MHDQVAQIMTVVGFEHNPSICWHACLIEPRHATRGACETARRIAAGNFGDGVRIEMVGVLVGQDHPVRLNVLCAEGRQREAFEPVQPFAGIGEVGIEEDPPACRGTEREPGLTQPIQPHTAGRHRGLPQIRFESVH